MSPATAWAESPGPPHVLNDGSFLLLSERDGWLHAYLVSRSGDKIEPVTKGAFDIVRVEAIERP